MNRPLQLGVIGQVSRTVSDIRRAEEWYGGVLGLRHLYSFGTLAFYDCGGTRLFLSQDENPPAHESILYLSVDDIRRAQAELAARRRIHTRSAPGTQARRRYRGMDGVLQ